MKIFSSLYYPRWSITYKIVVAITLAVVFPISISAYIGLQQIASMITNSKYHQLDLPVSNMMQHYLQSMIAVGGISSIVAMLIGIYISRPIHALMIASQSLEQDDQELFNLIRQDLAQFATNPDDLGQLISAFLKMIDELHHRDRQIKTQVESLWVEIDRTRRDQEVAEITDNDQFQRLRLKIQQLRKHEQCVAETETDYFQRLQNQVQSLKERSDSAA